MGIGELLDHWFVDVFFDPSIGKELKMRRNCNGVVTGLDQRWDRMIADMNVQKLIDIRHPNPIGLTYNRLFLGIFERLHLIIAPFRGIWQMLNNAVIR